MVVSSLTFTEDDCCGAGKLGSQGYPQGSLMGSQQDPFTMPTAATVNTLSSPLKFNRMTSEEDAMMEDFNNLDVNSNQSPALLSSPYVKGPSYPAIQQHECYQLRSPLDPLSLPINVSLENPEFDQLQRENKFHQHDQDSANISPLIAPEESQSPNQVPCQEFNDSSEKVVPWEDVKIAREAKMMLKQKRMGKYLPGDTVAHLEFFYNTLNMEMTSRIEDPFKNPDKYPALNFQVLGSPETILEAHRKITQPQAFMFSRDGTSEVDNASDA